MDTEKQLIAKIQHFYDYLNVQLWTYENSYIAAQTPESLSILKKEISDYQSIIQHFESTFKETIYEEKF